jgi:hypothetical protein
MAQNKKTKALSDLIDNPREIAAIMADPADGGMRFYKALQHKEKQYVAFAAGLGLIAYGFYLKSTGSHLKNANQIAPGRTAPMPDLNNAPGDYSTGDVQGGDFNGDNTGGGDFNDSRNYSGGDYNQNNG